MLSKNRVPAALGLALVAAVSVAGCSLVKKKPPTLAYEERPVELLFSVGAENLDRHQWNDAVNYFREVERQHPYSEWSRRAILMTAYAHYEANNYAEAIADADRFIALYPGNASTPYAYYIKAVCYFEQIVDVGRDQAYTENAMASLGDVVKRYPGTEYARDASVKLDMVRDQLAGKEMTIGRYYLRAGDPIAAVGRFRNVVDRYQTTSHIPEALYRLVEADLTMGLTSEAVRVGAVLGYNYPGDAWYRDAYRLLTSKGLRPAAAPGTAPDLPRLLPFGKRKGGAFAPPAVSVANAGDARTAAAAPSPTPAGKSAKKTDVVHGLLGL
ncbi:MAG: outer membrane protein assembly factor BamD [Caulobacteraceae bacterium]